MARVLTVNDALDGHVVLDIECLDRIYLNAYVPILQSSGQVVAFMTQHLGMPIPSPALMEKISTRRPPAMARPHRRDQVGETGKPEQDHRVKDEDEHGRHRRLASWAG